MPLVHARRDTCTRRQRGRLGSNEHEPEALLLGLAFFGNVGGSPWPGVQTQYCRNVLAGTTSCAGVLGADFVKNPTHQLKGVWMDPTPVPSDIVTLGLAQNLHRRLRQPVPDRVCVHP